MKFLIIIISLFTAISSSILFSLDFDNRSLNSLQLRKEKKWGFENFSVLEDKLRGEKVLKVAFPKGSASPNVTKVYEAPVGGGEFLAETGKYDSVYLEYHVKFSENFDFVKGGKLPGLFGGTANSGGEIPSGYDGFSTRMMWREKGLGELYAYMPSSKQWGTPIGNGKWNFKSGKWYTIGQKLVLNTPNKKDGSIAIWINNKKVHEESNLLFRKTSSLKINGIFFSTFFGGNDTTWASNTNCHIYFDNFTLTSNP